MQFGYMCNNTHHIMRGTYDNFSVCCVGRNFYYNAVAITFCCWFVFRIFLVHYCLCINNFVLFIVLALNKRQLQWTVFVTGGCMIPGMMLLCCVNLSGMSLQLY